MAYTCEQLGLLDDIEVTIECLESLVADLKAIRDGTFPTAADLERAPLIHGYSVVSGISHQVIGRFIVHPMRPGDSPERSERFVFAEGPGWVRTLTCLFRLGRPKGNAGKLDA
jgi:hypothetical protein